MARRLGQHFLRDPKVVADTLDALSLRPGERVLEIGPGKGALTQDLASAVGNDGKVVAIELDAGLAAGLRAVVQPQVEIVEGDAVRVDLTEWGPFDKIAGNLPYQISSPLTFRVLDMPFDRAVFLYQLEFAQRLAAAPGDPAYGRLSVSRAFRAKASLLRRVPKGAFLPKPRVLSALVVLQPHEEAPFDVGEDLAFFDRLVRELFSQRRKTLRRALSNRAHALGLPELNVTHAASILEKAGVTVNRVEELSPEGFGRLARVVDGMRVQEKQERESSGG